MYQFVSTASRAHKVVKLIGISPATGGVAPIALLKALGVLLSPIAIRFQSEAVV
jgi:hypothetical protein